MLTTHSSLPNQAVAMARTDSQEMHTLLTCAEPVQLQQADPAMLKSMAAVGVLGVKTRPRIPISARRGHTELLALSLQGCRARKKK